MNGMILQTAPENKDIKFSKSLVKNTQENGDENLFASLIEKLVNEDEESLNHSFLLSKLLDFESSLPQMGKKVSFFSGGELKEQNLDESQGEFALLEELFKVALMVKNGEDLSTFSTKSKTLALALKDKAVISALKNAKTIKDLLKIAKDNGIEVKNFQFFSEKLALDPKDKKLVNKLTSSDIFQMAEQLKSNKPFILKTISNKKVVTKDIKAPKSILHEILNSNHTEKNQKPSTNENLVLKKDIPQQSKKHTQNLNSNSTNENILDIDHHKQSSKKEQIISTKDSENLLSDDGFDSVQHHKNHKNTLTTLLKNSDQKDSVQNRAALEPKEPIQKSDSTKEDKSLETLNSDEITHEDKGSTTTIKSDISVKTKEAPEVKRTLNTFAMEFKEKVESYKPPLMKVKMQLNPQNLGEVDVTLINRGNSLHVNITSNPNSMAIFMQNQAEFRNSLVNMGFSDLQMNFSQNDESKGQQQGKKGSRHQADFENYEEENNPSVDVILPYYV